MNNYFNNPYYLISSWIYRLVCAKSDVRTPESQRRITRSKLTLRFKTCSECPLLCQLRLHPCCQQLEALTHLSDSFLVTTTSTDISTHGKSPNRNIKTIRLVSVSFYLSSLLQIPAVPFALAKAS